MKVIFLNCSNLDFESNGERIKGTSIKYIECIPPKGDKPQSFVPGKQWIKPEQTQLINTANALTPGEIIDLDYSLDGKKVVFSGILPTGELAVDLDNIFS